jgi:hypothetical protein
MNRSRVVLERVRYSGHGRILSVRVAADLEESPHSLPEQDYRSGTLEVAEKEVSACSKLSEIKGNRPRMACGEWNRGD